MNHLNIDQCKKLKAWGFPQDTHFSYTDNLMGGSPKLSWKGKVETRDRHTFCACPTLEELIEWLPRTIKKHNGLKDEWSDDWFYVLQLSPYDELWGASYDFFDHSIYSEFGNTPIEAVYNLAITIKGENVYGYECEIENECYTEITTYLEQETLKVLDEIEKANTITITEEVRGYLMTHKSPDVAEKIAEIRQSLTKEREGK